MSSNSDLACEELLESHSTAKNKIDPKSTTPITTSTAKLKTRDSTLMVAILSADILDVQISLVFAAGNLSNLSWSHEYTSDSFAYSEIFFEASRRFAGGGVTILVHQASGNPCFGHRYH